MVLLTVFGLWQERRRHRHRSSELLCYIVEPYLHRHLADCIIDNEETVIFTVLGPLFRTVEAPPLTSDPRLEPIFDPHTHFNGKIPCYNILIDTIADHLRSHIGRPLPSTHARSIRPLILEVRIAEKYTYFSLAMSVATIYWEQRQSSENRTARLDK